MSCCKGGVKENDIFFLRTTAPDQAEATRNDIGWAQACEQLVARQGLGPNETDAGKFPVGDTVMAKMGNLTERENAAKYMKSHTISSEDWHAQEFRPNHLILVGCQAKTNEAGLQTGYHRIESMLQGIALNTCPALERICSSETLTEKLAGFAARQAPPIGLIQMISFQDQQVWNNSADLSQIEIATVRGGIFSPDFFPETKQRAGAGMQDLGIGLACASIVVNYHHVTPRAEADRCLCQS